MNFFNKKSELPSAISHPTLGVVVLRSHPKSRKVSLRNTRGRFHVVYPAGIDPRRLFTIVDELAKSYMAKHPAGAGQLYGGDDRLVFDDWEVVIRRTATGVVGGSQRVCATPGPRSVVSVGASLDIDDATVQKSISDVIIKVAANMAQKKIPRRVEELAQMHGLRPSSIKISHGRRTLGTCSSRGVVSISALTMFLPPHLRDYIILHELSHLVEHNHSARFHEVCDRLCRGREKELERELKRFTWPVQR